ncbi:hypothetical protein OF83DRAFT_1098099 [Amylostereum chailletii]|nr:hypothetical protein OF83DRAFT_1098099 [Amylostereum chailletii]
MKPGSGEREGAGLGGAEFWRSSRSSCERMTSESSCGGGRKMERRPEPAASVVGGPLWMGMGWMEEGAPEWGV